MVEPNARDERLLSLLQQHHKSRKNRIIIFVLYKKEAPRVEALLKRRGWTAAAIHGDISQAQRTAAVEAFKAGTCPLLIATGGFRGAIGLRGRGSLLLGSSCERCSGAGWRVPVAKRCLWHVATCRQMQRFKGLGCGNSWERVFYPALNCCGSDAVLISHCLILAG